MNAALSSVLPVAPAEAALAVGVVAVGASIQGSVGFGANLIAAPLLMLLDARFVPGPLLAAAVVLTALMTWRERRHVDLLGLRYAFAGRVAGTVPAALLVSAVSASVFEAMFGALVVVAVALSLVGPRVRPTPATSAGAGALSGFMATTAAIGGPPMALLYQHAAGSRLRGTLAGYFLLGASLSLAALAVAGRYGRSEIGLSMILIPGMVIGFLVSGPLAPRLDRRGVRPLILVLSLAAGLVVLYRAVR